MVLAGHLEGFACRRCCKVHALGPLRHLACAPVPIATARHRNSLPYQGAKQSGISDWDYAELPAGDFRNSKEILKQILQQMLRETRNLYIYICYLISMEVCDFAVYLPTKAQFYKCRGCDENGKYCT